MQEAIKADPRVMQLVSERFEMMTRLLAEAINQREGWSGDDLRSRALAASLFGLLALALHEFEVGSEPCSDAALSMRLSELFQQAVDAEHQARAHRRPPP